MSPFNSNEKEPISLATTSIQPATKNKEEPIPLVITSVQAATESVKSFAKVRDSQFRVIVIILEFQQLHATENMFTILQIILLT